MSKSSFALPLGKWIAVHIIIPTFPLFLFGAMNKKIACDWSFWTAVGLISCFLFFLNIINYSVQISEEPDGSHVNLLLTVFIL